MVLAPKITLKSTAGVAWGWLLAFKNLAHLVELKLSRRELIWEFGALRVLGIVGIKNLPKDKFGLLLASVPVDPELPKPPARFWDKICLKICCVILAWLG